MADTTNDTPKQASVSQRQVRFGATAGVYTLLVIAILAGVNYLAREPRFNKTYDTTANKRFTLSDETIKIVGGLKQDATISYIDRTDRFPAAQALLDRYKNVSNKIQVRYIDALRQPDLVRFYGVGVGTAVIELEGRKQAAKQLDEEGITGAFVKVLKGVRKVCFVKGSGEHPVEGDSPESLAFFKTLLERDNYSVESITLIDKPAVPADCNVTVVAGPQNNYTAGEVTALKTMVETGGRVLFLLDPPVNIGSQHTADNQLLLDQLSKWGVTLDKDLIIEQRGLGRFTILVNEYQSHPIVNALKDQVIALQIARSLDAKNADKTTVTKLFSTSDAAVAATNLNKPPDVSNPAETKKGPFVLAAAGTYDSGKPSDPGRFVVVGNSNFVGSSDLGIGFQSNRDFALNIVNWLSSDEDLISIRPKDADNRTFSANPSQLATFQYAVVFAIPLMIIVIGVAIYLKRR